MASTMEAKSWCRVTEATSKIFSKWPSQKKWRGGLEGKVPIGDGLGKSRTSLEKPS